MVRVVHPGTLGTMPSGTHCPLLPHLLAAFQVAVGTVHSLHTISRAIHQELQQPVHWREPTGTLHQGLVPAERLQPRSGRPCRKPSPLPFTFQARAKNSTVRVVGSAINTAASLSRGPHPTQCVCKPDVILQWKRSCHPSGPYHFTGSF